MCGGSGVTLVAPAAAPVWPAACALFAGDRLVRVRASPAECRAALERVLLGAGRADKDGAPWIFAAHLAIDRTTVDVSVAMYEDISSTSRTLVLLRHMSKTDLVRFALAVPRLAIALAGQGVDVEGVLNHRSELTPLSAYSQSKLEDLDEDFDPFTDEEEEEVPAPAETPNGVRSESCRVDALGIAPLPGARWSKLR